MKMWKWILALAGLLVSASAQAHVSAVPFPEVGSLHDAHKAAFAIFQTYSGPPQITCDLVSGVASIGGPCTSGTTCNGVSDDAPAFKAFNTWAVANQGSINQAVLNIPAGKTCFFNSSQTYPIGLANAFASGINNLILDAAGSTITSVGGVGFTLGGSGICHKGLTDGSGCSARIQSASAGASTLTLTASSFSAGYISRFSVGKWIMIAGLDMQGQWNFPLGYPPNAYYFEWRQITAVCNNTGPCSGTATVTLDRPLTNSYLSTWPNYNAGNAFEADQGGPATIYTVGDYWNTTQEYRNVTLSSSGQINNNGRNITYRNMIVGAGDGAIPSQNETWSAYTVNYTGLTMEVDKLIGTMTIDGMTISQLKFQSSSVDLFVGRNLTVSNNLTGGAKRSEITDSTLTAWKPGSYTYGESTTNICTRCAVASFIDTGGVIQTSTDFTSASYTMSGGVIQFPNTSATGGAVAQRPFAPMPSNIFYAVAGGGGDTIGLFRPQSITQDPTNTFVATNEAGGFPTWSGGINGFRGHPSPRFTCDTCTGDFSLVSTSIQNGATALAPLGSYSSAAFAPTSAQGNLGTFPARGSIVSATIAVTQAYSGAGNAILHLTGSSDNLPTVDQSTWTTFVWGPQINLKQTGVRVIAPSGVTCDGVAAPTGCAGDSLGTALPVGGVWIRGGITPWMGSTLGVGTQPLVTITFRTDQGVVP